MNKLVPGLIISMCLSVFSQLATAQGTPLLKAAMNIAGGASCNPSDYEKIDEKVCLNTGKAFCRDVLENTSPDKGQCDKITKDQRHVVSENCKLDESGIPLAGSSYATLVSECAKVSSAADVCCGSNLEACMKQIPDIATLSGRIHDTTSTADICKKLAEDTKVGAEVNAAIAGTCIARKKYWKNECDLLKTRAQLAVKNAGLAAGGSSSGTLTMDPNLQKLANMTCPADPTRGDAAAQADAMTADSSVAAMCKGESSDIAGPGGDEKPAPGSPEADDDGDGIKNKDEEQYKEAAVNKKGGGMGDMMSMLGPLMESLMKEDETEEQEKDDIDCQINPANCPVNEAPKIENTAVNAGTMNSSAAGFDPVFNPDELPSALGDPGLTAMAGTPAGAGGTIPNGGGSMPGGLGGGGGGGMPGGGAYKSAAVDPKNIGGGFNSYGGGGLGAMNSAMKLDPQSGGGGYRQPAGGNEPDFDLRALLPGGAKDPRKLAGNTPKMTEIQDKGVNIWFRISDRFKSHCNQGLLRDCTP